ncbi:MAG TPA: EamA family transporter [Anaerolineae bacterium]|nr:EamA family transporter [Anaerolineae bacterium]
MDYFVLVFLGALWGASYLFIKIGGEQLPPITFVAARTTIAGISLLLVALARREKLPPLGSSLWKWLIAIGLLNSAVPYTLITWGELHVSSGLAAILVGAMPIFTVLLAHWRLHDERLKPRKVVGILIGFAGVVVLFLPDLENGLQWSLVGGAAILAAAISYASAAIVARLHLKSLPHVSVALGQMITASLILIPISLLFDHPWTLSPTPIAVGALVTLAVFGTAFAYLIYYWLIAHVGATRTSLVTYISPVVAVILGAVFLNESLEWNTLVGLILIIAGVGLVTSLSLGGRRAQAVTPVAE